MASPPSSRPDDGPRLYGGKGSKWANARASWLRLHPLCVRCEAAKRITPATVVDHIIPHKNDLSLFWSRRNWQSLCKPCHDGAKQSFEATGRERGCDESGIPLDAGHHWRRPAT